MPANIPLPSSRYPKSILWKDYDSSQAGAYFVTITSAGRAPLFGSAKNELIRLSEIGKAVHSSSMSLQGRFPSAVLDKFIIMPNHFHGILWLGQSSKSLRVDSLSTATNAPRAGAYPASPYLAFTIPIVTSDSLIPCVTTCAPSGESPNLTLNARVSSWT